MGSVGGRCETLSQVIFVDQHKVAHVQLAHQPGVFPHPVQQSHRPHAVVDPDSLFIEHQASERPQSIHLALVSKEHQHLAEILQPALLVRKRSHLRHRQNHIIVREKIDRCPVVGA